MHYVVQGRCKIKYKRWNKKNKYSVLHYVVQGRCKIKYERWKNSIFGLVSMHYVVQGRCQIKYERWKNWIFGLVYALCCPGPVLELRPHRTEAASSPGRLLHILTHTCFTHSLKYDIFLYSKLVIHEMWLYSFMGFWTKSGLEWIEWVVPLWLLKLLRTTTLENNLTHIYAHFHASTWQRDKDKGSLLPSQWKYKSHFQRINGGAAALLFYSHINIP